MDKIFISFMLGVLAMAFVQAFIATDLECVAEHGEEIIDLRDTCKSMFENDKICFQKAVVQYCE